MLRSVRLSSLDSEYLGHQGGRGDRRANHRPHLTFSTDDPGGVRPRSSWPHSHQQGDGGAHEPAFPSLGLPLLLLHLPTQGLVHVLRSPAMTWHPGPRQSAESEGIFGASSE